MTADRRRSLWAAAATLAVAAGLVAGLLHLGSPAERRLLRLDADRVDRLGSLSSDLETYYEKEGRLPAELSALSEQPWAARVALDPETHEPFSYELLAPDRYRLCAEFARPSPRTDPSREAGFWIHPRGRHCYEVEVESEEAEADGSVAFGPTTDP